MTEKQKQEQIAKIKLRIPYDEDVFGTQENYDMAIEDLFNDSYAIVMEILYPFENWKEYALLPKYYNWQIRCCRELYNLADKTGFTNYAETGFSWTKLSDGLSNNLTIKLTSHVGVPQKRKDVLLYETENTDEDWAYVIYKGNALTVQQKED